MENIDEENYDIPRGDVTFIKEAVSKFNTFVSKYPTKVDISDVILYICALYIQMRETMSKDDLMAQIERTLYLSEQTIRIHDKEFPGRYPSNSEEAQLKFEINDIFQKLNYDE